MSAREERGPGASELARCAEEMRAFLDELGPGYRVIIRDGFVVGSDLPEEELQSVVEGTLVGCTRRMQSQFFDHRPSWPMRVYLFANERSYGAGVRRLTGSAPTTPFGFYRSGLKSLVMNIATGTGTLAHEMVHAFADADFPRIRAWFNEGLGSLYEQSFRGRERMVGARTNWRFRGLMNAWVQRGSLPRLARLVNLSDQAFYRDDEGVNYALARSFCVFLQENGWLEAFYRGYRREHLEDPTGARSLEATVGMALEELDEPFLAFLRELNAESPEPVELPGVGGGSP
ncbi:MAG: hypothetical protein H6834_11720 [Planctomycetes bacterium]|nr:hypothetical protein [Planctomycetota bacterium]